MTRLLYFILTAHLLAYARSQDLHTVSIASRNDVEVLRPCVVTCLWGNGDVYPGAGCGYPYYNVCWCSSNNIAPSATAHISTCITSICSDNVDVATGIDIYYDYCSSAGYPIPNTVARPVATSVDLHTVSIASRNDFKILRPCVTTCLFGFGDVAPHAGCGYPFYNQCWCSSNIAPSATSHISSCITNYCTDSFDISTAVDIYYNYCSGAGHPIGIAAAVTNTAPLSTAVQTTPSSLTQTPTITAGVGRTSAYSPPILTASATLSSASLPSASPTTTNSNSESSSNGSNNNNSSSSSLSPGEIAGIVVGVLALLVGVAALWYQRRALMATLQNATGHTRHREPDEYNMQGIPSARRGIYQMR